MKLEIYAHIRKLRYFFFVNL